jgi:hypothetical protein
MSKGSNFWGTARGKLGNMVISSVKGQQVERKYQPQVTNPKTYAQMRQRAVFASAVKFFKHSQQNLFQFAFEDKMQKESDYNAFMRHNVRFFCPVFKTACDNPTLPALGFGLGLQLSFGSLPSVDDVSWFEDSKLFGFQCGTIKTATPNKYLWSEVSKAIIDKYGLSEGDIITFVVIDTKMTTGNFSNIIIMGLQAGGSYDSAKWTITQKQLSLTSEEDVTNFIQGTSYFGVKTDSLFSQDLCFGGVIFSRNIKGRSLMVSTSALSCSQGSDYTDVIPVKDSTMEKYILQSWGATEEAVLKGALL